jgi:hypothetical protein
MVPVLSAGPVPTTTPALGWGRARGSVAMASVAALVGATTSHRLALPPGATPLTTSIVKNDNWW